MSDCPNIPGKEYIDANFDSVEKEFAAVRRENIDIHREMELRDQYNKDAIKIANNALDLRLLHHNGILDRMETLVKTFATQDHVRLENKALETRDQGLDTRIKVLEDKQQYNRGRDWTIGKVVALAGVVFAAALSLGVVLVKVLQ